MSGIPLAKSEFKQIQTDLLTELTADLSVDHLDLDLGSSADDGTVQMTAVYMAFLVTGCDMEMKINVTVFVGKGTSKRNNLIISLKLDIVLFLCYSVVYASSEIIDGAKACDLCKADILFFCNLADLLQDLFLRIKTKIDRVSKTSVFHDKNLPLCDICHKQRRMFLSACQ